MADDLDQLDPEEEIERARIGRPAPAATPFTLRGINPQAEENPAATATPEEQPPVLPAQPASSPSLVAPTPNIPPPVLPAQPASQSPPTLAVPTPKIPTSPLQQQTERDRTQQQQLDKGSGITQISRNHPIGGGILRGLNVLGTVASPFVPGGRLLMQNIPGTEEHHNILVNRNTRAIGADEEQAAKEAGTAHTQAETGAIPAETALKEAQTAALGEPKPKEEKWDEFAGFTDKDG